MKKWFAPKRRRRRFSLLAPVSFLAAVILAQQGQDPGSIGHVFAQTENMDEEDNKPPDATLPLAPPDFDAQIEELLREKTIPTPVEQKIDSKIRAITGHMGRRMAEARSGETPTFSDLSTDLVKINDQGEIQVYVILKDFTREEVAQLEGLGLRVELTLPEHRLIQGWARYDAIEAIAALDSVQRITPPDYARHNSGAVNSQGDAVLRADVARSVFGVDGSGVKVCVFSDGVDHLAPSVASGDLQGSPPVQVLRGGEGDEGTAMLEIIHDLAPGAPLAFYGGNTDAEFLQGLSAFDAAGCRVIVDDIRFKIQAKFEDGPIAQRVIQLVESGFVYATAGGNDAQNHYIANYRRFPAVSGFPWAGFHNFSATGTDVTDRFLVPPDGDVTVVLQWSNKSGASADDFDLFLTRDDLTFLPCPLGPDGICASILPQNGQGWDPIEIISYTNKTGSPVFANVVILERHLVSDPSIIKLNYFVFPKNFPPGQPVRQYIVPEDSVFGHAAVNGVLSVAAINAGTPNVIEDFSSRGPGTILFPNPETRNVPNISGVDGVQTHVGQLGFFSINPFGGTSAAAPHVAAIAALLWQFNPTLTSRQVVQAITQNAVDLGSPGFDTTFGFGRIDAFLALSSQLRTLTVTVTGSGRVISSLGGITCPPTCTATLTAGTTLALVATPTGGATFGGWGGDCAGFGAALTCTLTMTSVKTVTATFNPPPLPDLVSAINPIPSTGTVGGSIQVSASVVNQGAASAGAFRLGFYFSNDTAITTGDVLFAICNFLGLAAGGSATCIGPVPIPTSLPPGVYFVGVIADDQGAVGESNETNNTAVTGPITVTTSTAVALNGSAFRTGQTITYQATLTPGSTSTQVDIYLGALLPDGVTFLSLVQLSPGVISFALGPFPTPFFASVTLAPLVVSFSYTFQGFEPVGTYLTYALMAVAGSNPLVTSNQLALGIQAFQFTP